MSLTATGQVTAEPDEGYISLGVETVAPTSGEAVKQNSAKMKNLFAVLKELGVEKKDFQTTRFTVDQNYKQVPHPTLKDRTKSEPDGFRVHNAVRVTVCELENFGKVLDAVTSNGVNRVSNISFGSSKANDLIAKARLEACKQVKLKAAAHCQGLDIELRRVRNVAESRNYQRERTTYNKSMLSDTSSSVPVSGGSLDFAVTVTVTWEVSDKHKVRILNPNIQNPKGKVLPQLRGGPDWQKIKDELQKFKE
jgi:uncharacterized protein YggE